jgi:hypothetical protein
VRSASDSSGPKERCRSSAGAAARRSAASRPTEGGRSASSSTIAAAAVAEVRDGQPVQRRPVDARLQPGVLGPRVGAEEGLAQQLAPAGRAAGALSA